MTPRHESPIAPETQETDAVGNVVDETAGAGGGEDGRQFPGRVRGQRLEITYADLTRYSFITGRAPRREERERALTWAEADPAHDAIAAAAAGAAATNAPSAIVPAAAAASYSMRAWYPSAISLRVREIWFNGITLRTARPQITHWLRRLSIAIQEGTKRVTRNRAA
jgi:hypothetical protein